MPYARSLQQYTPSEFYRQPPDVWERRLREVSPIVSNADHLVFRYFEPTNPDGTDRGWNFKQQGQWLLYSARPVALCAPEMHELYRLHWSELDETKREGRKAVVSDYQHFMWHARGLYVKPFLVLQGDGGGTPAKYTPAEVAFLGASNLPTDPFPLGFFPAAPFDERVVAQIGRRDRMLQCANDYDELLKRDRPDALKREDDAAEQVKRETFLDTWKVMIQPQVEFMQHFLKKSENRETLPDAPRDLPNTLSRWREHFMATGQVIGARVANQRQVNRMLATT